MLTWDPIEVMSCLGVLPIEEELGISHMYIVEKDGMRLELSVFQYDGDLSVALYRDGVADATFRIGFIDCDAARVIQLNGHEVIEFGAGRLFGGRYDGEGPIPYGVRIRVTPSIAVDVFKYHL